MHLNIVYCLVFLAYNLVPTASLIQLEVPTIKGIGRTK